MRMMILVVSAILASWAGTARAGDLLGTPLQVDLKLSSPLADTPRFTPHLLEPGDLQTLGMPGSAPLKLMAEGGGGVQMDTGTRAIVALLLSIFIGFGTGHFVLGDGSAVLFLALELGLIAVSIGVYVASIAAFAASGMFPPFIILTPIALIVLSGVRIWELVDCIFKSGIVGGNRSAAILPTGPELGRGFAFQPMAANGPGWRF